MTTDDGKTIYDIYRQKEEYTVKFAYLVIALYSFLTVINIYTAVRYLCPLIEKRFHSLMLIMMQISYTLLLVMYIAALIFHSKEKEIIESQLKDNNFF